MYPFRILAIKKDGKHLFRVVYQSNECYGWEGSGPQIYRQRMIKIRSVSVPEITEVFENGKETVVYLRGINKRRDHYLFHKDSAVDILDLEHINQVFKISYSQNEPTN